LSKSLQHFKIKSSPANPVIIYHVAPNSYMPFFSAGTQTQMQMQVDH